MAISINQKRKFKFIKNKLNYQKMLTEINKLKFKDLN